MVLAEIYTGLKVRVTGHEGSWEVTKKEEYCMSAWCKRIDSSSSDIREFSINQLQRL